MVGNPNSSLKKNAIESSANQTQVTNAKKRKASTRIPSFRRFIRTKGDGTPKGPAVLKSKGVIDGQNVRKHYLKNAKEGEGKRALDRTCKTTRI